jgi:hypothetical protein
LAHRAPVAYSQLQHWNHYRLHERHALRHVASAMRLRGHLDVDALRRSLVEIVRRQAALRTRIAVVEGIPVQEIIAPADAAALSCEDLSALRESERDSAAQQHIERLILEPVDACVGPLFEAKLLKLSEREHVLIVAMEHLITDTRSLAVFWRELFPAYVQAVQSRAFSLPAIPMQFADYAVQQNLSQRAWLEQHGAYWHGRLASAQRLRFPDCEGSSAASRIGWGSVPVRIGADLTSELREWSQRTGAPLVRSVFTAYAALVLRWCDAPEAIFQSATHGRAHPDLQQTIGYFASVLYPRVELRAEDRWIDLMNRIKLEYRMAQEHADAFYLETQEPRPAFTRNTIFNFNPREPDIDLAELAGTGHELACSAVPFANPLLKQLDRDGEPGVLLKETDEDIGGAVLFPLNRFSAAAMERFARGFLLMIEHLLRHPERRVEAIPLE